MAESCTFVNFNKSPKLIDMSMHALYTGTSRYTLYEALYSNLFINVANLFLPEY